MKNFPKILFVNGEPLSNISATGITVSNLLKDWPRDSIAQIYTANLPTNLDGCMFSARLTASDLWPFTILGSRSKSNTMASTATVTTNPISVASRKGLRAKLQYACTPLLDLLPYRLPTPLIKRIEEFQPDVIYSLLGNIRITRLVYCLGRRLQIPVVPHFMDDWLATYSVPDKSAGTLLHRMLLNRSVRNLFDRVPLGMAIGEKMAEEYSRKFGCSFLPFMNPVDSVLNENKVAHNSGAPLIFVYVGGLHLRRDHALLDVIHVLSDINRDGVVAELHIYAPRADEEKATQLASLNPSVHYCGSVRPEEVAEILTRCDVAIHVESREPSIAQYTRFSVSTKIPQYFAGGLPVLAYGPVVSASSLYIESSKAGVSIDGGNKSPLHSAVKRLIADSQWREELGVAALNVARERHLGERVRDDFAAALLRAVSNGEQSNARA